MFPSDLHVESISSALAGREVDVIVSGSIGAVEAVRFVRALRRLGANTHVWLTAGGAQFTTPMALAWASANPITEHFSGEATHIAVRDACVIAPASANFIGKLAQGITDSPATALAASYLGMRRPVLVLPNMHHSLAEAPAIKANLAVVKQWTTVLEPRLEEGKLKFPDPAVLADTVAHHLNRNIHARSVLVTMGSTRGYVDDVRYLSNYSSGKLGTLTAEELYRRGLDTHVLTGSAKFQPRSFTSLQQTLTNDELQQSAQKLLQSSADSVVMAASVLDFAPDHKQAGKISSSANNLSLTLKPTTKILAELKPRNGVKVGFKLETELNEAKARQIADDYMPKYKLSMMVLNKMSDVDDERHTAFVITDDQTSKSRQVQLTNSKAGLANAIADHVVHGGAGAHV